jgi:hypothetical protein
MLLTIVFLSVVSGTPVLEGNANAVAKLLERKIGSSSHFLLQVTPDACGRVTCFRLTDSVDGRISVVGTSASELSAGVGHYLREYCNMTMGWARGGNSHFYQPQAWPRVGASVEVHRVGAWSFAENVCTASYTLVWHSWAEWEAFLDWAALWGINLLPAGTGQEEVQYKTLQAFGLNDLTIRNWFNGPALLTWSRGQNSHGNGILGPLPRSWMQSQWHLQKDQILPRMRELAIAGQLPGFQGNVPWALAALLPNTNISQGGGTGNGTGWMDSRDPNFGRIADKWMATLLSDFGTIGSIYQMDSFFKPTGWGAERPIVRLHPSSIHPSSKARPLASSRCAYGLSEELLGAQFTPPHGGVPTKCIWSAPIKNAHLNLSPHSTGPKTFDTLAAAQSACEATRDCNGLTSSGNSSGSRNFSLRLCGTPYSSIGSTAYIIENNLECRQFPVDTDWLGRGQAGYEGLARSDPSAVWAWQGWGIYEQDEWSPPTPNGISQLRGWLTAPPKVSVSFG